MVKTNEEGRWLNEGQQTKSSQRIEEIVEEIGGKSEGEMEFVVNAVKYIQENIDHDTSNKDEEFRRRTAGEIIDDGYSTGCTDYTLAFIAIARERGIPTKYIEGIRGGEKHLKQVVEEESNIMGHVIAECFLNGDWYAVDPTRGVIGLSPDRVVCREKFIVLWEALDSWDLGIRSLEDLKKKIKEYAEGRD